MSAPSIETDNRSSTIIEDNTSITVHDLSDTTVTSHTSASWHSVVSYLNVYSTASVRSHSLNNCLKICLIEPDIRLTTVQDWKLRTSMKRLLSLCNLPLKVSCTKARHFKKESFSNIHQEQPIYFMIDSSLKTLINHPWLRQGQTFYDRFLYIALCLRLLPTIDLTNSLFDVQFIETYSNHLQNKASIHIPIIKAPKLIFYISSNLLKLTLRSNYSLLDLQFSTRQTEFVHGCYYKWNYDNSEHVKYNVKVDVDHGLINEFNAIDIQ